MGRGSYTAGDWAILKSSRKISSASETQHLFSSSSVNPKYIPRSIKIRESRDSEDSPASTPVIIGFDVTASMGYLAKELASNAVSSTIISLLDKKAVSDPHIMCCAVGDCKSDTYPLQATQFEADIRINHQLLDLYLEGGGGGNGGESYNLLWYFAARHTMHDCYEIRKKKGILFTIGDDKCHPSLTADEIEKVFGEKLPYDISNEELLTEVGEKYHTVHIQIENNNSSDSDTFSYWYSLMPGYCTRINKNDIAYLSYLITAIISIVYGISENTVLKAENQIIAEKIAPSVALIKPQKEKKNILIL